MNSSVVCVDASLILRTLVPGPLSGAADAFLVTSRRDAVTLIAPALLQFEVTSALRRLTYLKRISAGDGDRAFEEFLKIDIRLSHRRDMFSLAWHLAKRFNRSRAYDATYVALAQLNECELWTADEKLFNAFGDELRWVRWIGEAALAGGSSTD
jgi:predicted nucleic acid-binding protein